MNVMYKWLPIIFGCHCLDSRSFHYRGTKFPICARCTGELVGIIVGVILWFIVRLPLYLYVILLVPMIVDGCIQMFSSYESSNLKRFLTGLLFGYGIISLFIISNLFVYELGISVGR